MTRPFADRFWEKVRRSDDPTACWLWTSALDGGGYGLFQVGSTTTLRAHRLAWEMANGPIPSGLFVCHQCDIRHCVRPDHLFLGTAADNTDDMLTKGRGAHGDRAGLRVHPEAAPRGERNSHAKLTADDVLAIRALSAAGVKHIRLAERYGVSDTSIAWIVSRRTWRHID